MRLDRIILVIIIEICILYYLMAGFLREVFEKEEYALNFMKKFKKEKIIKEA